MSLKYILMTVCGLQVILTQLGPVDRASIYLPKEETIQSPKRCVLKNKQDGGFR
jgi:hypothetical protein